MTEKIEVDVDVKLLPQLLVMSAITESPGGGNYPFISNKYCMARDGVELQAEIDEWVKGCEADGYKLTRGAVTVVPKEVYAQPGTRIEGIKAKHARVSPTCQANKTTVGAGHEAIMLLMEEYQALAALEVNKNANFHFVLTVERP